MMSFIKEKKDELINMLNSKDLEDVKLAFTIMETHVEKRDYGYLRYIAKKSSKTEMSWSIHAPKCSGYMRIDDMQMPNTRWTDIIAGILNDIDLTTEEKEEQTHFIATQMNADVLKFIQSQSDELKIKSIDVTFNYNEQEPIVSKDS